MKVKLNLEKRYAYAIIGILLIASGIIFINAVTPNPGHSAVDIDFSAGIDGTAAFNGRIDANLGFEVEGDGIPSSQGLGIGWNHDSGSGATWFTNNAGGGGGGFYFDNLPSGGVLTRLMTITGVGDVGIGRSPTTYKLEVEGDIYSTGWLRTAGGAGWYSQDHGGGWHMTESTWVRSYNDKNVWTGGVLGSNGGLTIGYNGVSPPSSGAIISGNVGIGVSNPSIDLAIGDSDTGLQQNSDGDLSIVTNSAERIRINANGDVRIGSMRISSNGDVLTLGDVIYLIPPASYTLNVDGDMRANKYYDEHGDYYLQPSLQSKLSSLTLTGMVDSSLQQGISIGWNHDSGSGATWFVNNAGAGGGGFNFDNIPNGGVQTRLMTITGTGNLDVTGEISGSHGRKGCYWQQATQGQLFCPTGYYMAGADPEGSSSLTIYCCQF